MKTFYLRMLVCAGWLTIASASTQTVLADELDDEFGNPKTLSQWKVRDTVERGERTYETIAIGQSRKGWLTIIPRAEHGWYRDGMGPMLFKELDGDFLVETSVVTESKRKAGTAPSGSYNSAGLIVRDPKSKRGSQNWVVVNVGNQSKFTGSEAKTTVNSDSHLELQRGSHSGRLRLARMGTKIYALRMLEGEDKWTLIREMDRPDLPTRVQVGPMANGWSKQADLIAHFDYLRFSTPRRQDDLTSTR